jgi:hypothetical protein
MMQFSNDLFRRLALATPLAAIVLVAASAQQSNSSKATNSSNKQNQGGQNRGAEVRTEKIKFKQDFGPQAVAGRGDRSTTVAPHGQNNGSNGSTGSSSAIKQEFGPQPVARRGDRMTAPAPPPSSGGKSQTPAPAAIGPNGKPAGAISPATGQNKP